MPQMDGNNISGKDQRIGNDKMKAIQGEIAMPRNASQ